MSDTPRSPWTTVSAICLVAGGLVMLGCSRDAPHARPMDGKLRIVSLAPSVTEILFALALGGFPGRCDGSLRLSTGGAEHRAGWRVRHAQRGKATGPESRPGDRSRV